MLNVKKFVPKCGIGRLVNNIMIVENPSAFEVTFFPMGSPFINVATSSKICLRKSDKIIETYSYICGQAMANFNMTLPNIDRILVIEFHPFSLKRIFKHSALDLYDQQVPLELVDKELAIGLHDLVDSSLKSDSILSLVQDLLIKRFPDPVLDSRVLHSLDMMMLKYGDDKIRTLSNSVNLSNRRLEQLFLSNVGISAKKYSRIIRFNKTLFDFFDDNLNRLSVTNSYFDQAHFIHEIKKMSGMSPTMLASHLTNDINRFSAMGSNLYMRYPVVMK